MVIKRANLTWLLGVWSGELAKVVGNWSWFNDWGTKCTKRNPAVYIVDMSVGVGQESMHGYRLGCCGEMMYNNNIWMWSRGSGACTSESQVLKRAGCAWLAGSHRFVCSACYAAPIAHHTIRWSTRRSSNYTLPFGASLKHSPIRHSLMLWARICSCPKFQWFPITEAVRKWWFWCATG